MARKISATEVTYRKNGETRRTLRTSSQEVNVLLDNLRRNKRAVLNVRPVQLVEVR
jgi:hypothetical protein